MTDPEKFPERPPHFEVEAIITDYLVPRCRMGRTVTLLALIRAIKEHYPHLHLSEIACLELAEDAVNACEHIDGTDVNHIKWSLDHYISAFTGEQVAFPIVLPPPDTTEHEGSRRRVVTHSPKPPDEPAEGRTVARQTLGELLDCQKASDAWIWFLNGPGYESEDGMRPWWSTRDVVSALVAMADCPFDETSLRGVPVGIGRLKDNKRKQIEIHPNTRPQHYRGTGLDATGNPIRRPVEVSRETSESGTDLADGDIVTFGSGLLPDPETVAFVDKTSESGTDPVPSDAPGSPETSESGTTVEVGDRVMLDPATLESFAHDMVATSVSESGSDQDPAPVLPTSPVDLGDLGAMAAPEPGPEEADDIFLARLAKWYLSEYVTSGQSVDLLAAHMKQVLADANNGSYETRYDFSKSDYFEELWNLAWAAGKWQVVEDDDDGEELIEVLDEE